MREENKVVKEEGIKSLRKALKNISWKEQTKSGIRQEQRECIQ